MITISISDLRTHLRVYLDRVQNGEDVFVTKRGRIIARLSPITGGLLQRSRYEMLVRTGVIEPPETTDPLPPEFWQSPGPPDPEGVVMRALLDERNEGW